MKVLFLDVDGVLNNQEDLKNNGMLYACADKIAILKKIVDETDVQIVLSSTWRILKKYRDHIKWCLRKQGMKIIDKTPRPPKMSMYWSRAEEIKAWLDENDVLDYVIIDDDPRAEIEGHFFKTSFDTGLTDDIANSIIERFRCDS